MKKVLLFAFALISICAKAQVYPHVDGFETYTDAAELGTQGGYTSDMMVYTGHGTGLSKGVAAVMNNSNTVDSLVTPFVGPLTAQSVLTFQYRVVESAGYPNNAATWGAGDKIEVWGRPELSSNFVLFATIDQGNYLIGTDFNTVTLSLEAGAGVNAYFMIKVTRGTVGDYFVDFDEMSISNVTTGLIIKPTTSNPVCNGASNGSISLLIEGGTAPYTYTWNPVLPATGTQTNLTAGTYSVTVEDNVGRSATKSITLTQPEPLMVSTVATNVSCNGGNNGAVDLTVSNGVAPYSFLWSNSAVSEDVSGLTAGTYFVVVADVFNCTAAASQVVSEAEALTVTETHTDVTAPGADDATITVTAAGGASNYQYSLNGGAYFASGVFNNLAEGCYTVRVKDGNDCEYISSPVCVSEIVAGLREFSFDQIVVYPNPANNYINIRLRTAYRSLAEVTITDPAGSVVLKRDVSGTDIRLDVSHIATGKYILTYKSSRNSLRKHIAIVH